MPAWRKRKSGTERKENKAHERINKDRQET